MTKPIGVDQQTVLEILVLHDYKRTDIHFIQPHAGNKSLIVRYKYWHEIKSKMALEAILVIYPDSYVDTEEHDDKLSTFTLVLE